MIRALAVSLALFLAAGASAQIVSPIEQSYGPYPRPSDGYEPALAVSRDGILLAWSEITSRRHTQIRIGLLDFHGRLVSPITTVATEGNAAFPAVFHDGTSFRVEYVESDMRFSVDVDSAGAPMGLPRLALPRGEVLTARFNSPICFIPFCSPTGQFLTLSWSGPGVSGSYKYDNATLGTVGPIAGAQRGDNVALAWYTPKEVVLADIRGSVPNIVMFPASVKITELPGIGCDDTHCLLVFTTKTRKIYGLMFDPSQPWPPQPVPIETASFVERPQVHVLRNGRFLVVYTSGAVAPHQRFAGRIVTTVPQPRRRAVH